MRTDFKSVRLNVIFLQSIESNDTVWLMLDSILSRFFFFFHSLYTNKIPSPSVVSLCVSWPVAAEQQGPYLPCVLRRKC